ncbi:NAD(P)H-dependent oxidoreductase [Brevibacterium luteolum]|uniref:NAD(P)H dehydrogenase n=1 Tax=Brevibacterium luteolum TaxID=199591 RepID=A0A2N6PKE3_9MICO|nr:NAD(P)H-dependent oxidoreductase [Brevibacterium luteolum]PMB99151.1 NAD(P)H dehydrogenase [Brevibacterium luteolum]QIN28521.1 NAD(P)H dehydrogenase [Brevibacterium luteolum]
MKTVAIIYHSSTGNVHQMAQAAQTHAEQLGHRVLSTRLPELDDPDATAAAHQNALGDLEAADAVLWGTPGRYGAMSGPMKYFLDQTLPLHQRGVLADKYMSTFVSTASNHGGQESTILAFNNVLYHWGAIIVPAGAAGEAQAMPFNGNPYGISSVSKAQPDAVPSENLDAMKFLVERLLNLVPGE